jgi:tartrate-resistant acid phosphatase type 5
MTPSFSSSRRRFLRQSFAFSAAALAGTSIVSGCGSGIVGSIGPSSHLLVIGDWGAGGDFQNQQNVATGMQAYAAQRSYTVDAMLMLGDNFYGTLTDGVNSSRWNTQFEQMYPTSLCSGAAYAIPGNHDYEISPMAKYPEELSYAKKPGTRWTMPAQYYSFKFPQADPLVTVIALDTNVEIPGRPAPSGFYVMSDESWQQQLEWFKAELQKPLTTPYLIVMGHHPVYSNGIHGDHPVLVRDWDPLLRAHNVHAYLGGHDHDMQHLEFDDHPTSFFLSGGGGANLYPIAVDPSKRGPMAQQVHGFSHIEARREALTFRHIDPSGNVIHAFRKTPGGKVTYQTT